MAERIYPAAKPNPHPPSAAAPPQFPATKAQTYGRPPYRPQPPLKRRRRSRSCCCSCCLWITLILLALLFLAAIAGGVFYVIYRPHRPDFTVTSLRLTQFNLTKSGALTSRLDLSLTAKNPNKKISFIYDPVSISVSSNDVTIGEGSFPAFVHGAKNTTVLKAAVTSGSGDRLDSSSAADLKKKSSIPLQIDLDTKAGVKFAGIKTKKIGIKVSCDGLSVALPKKKAAAASSVDVSCKVKLRIKIWKWTF